jgi:hypothetical protein
MFVETQAEFRRRIGLRRNTLVEKVATKHAALLKHVRSITEDDILRGDGREEPDLVGDLTSEIFRVFTVFHRLETLGLIVRIAYGVLFVTIALGLLGALGAAAFTSARSYAFVAGVALVIVQFLTVAVIMIASNKLEVYEDVS